MKQSLSFIVFLSLLVLFLLPASGAFAQSSNFYTDCEKYPGSLGCMPSGDSPPSETVPSENRVLELLSGPVFAGGGCPANVNVLIFGRSYTAVNMVQACSWIVSYIKPLMLLLASLSAVFIVFPRES